MKIIYWERTETELIKREVKRRDCDVKKFKYKSIYYTIFKNNLENTFCLLGKIGSQKSKNFLLTLEDVEQIKSTKVEDIYTKIMPTLKKWSKSQLSEWLQIYV